MTRSIASTLVLLGVAGAAAFGHAHPFGDPRSGRGESTGSPLANAEIPAQAKAVLLSKCADCHSAETRWPVYARLAPGSWLIERDIIEARKHMDLSHWQELSVDQQEVLEAEIAQQAKLGRMPPLQYRLLHWNARLSPGDVEAFGHLRQSVETSSEAGTQGGDPVHGSWFSRSIARDATPWTGTARVRALGTSWVGRQLRCPRFATPTHLRMPALCGTNPGSIGGLLTPTGLYPTMP